MADSELLVSISADISGLTSQLAEASAAIGDFANSGTDAGDKLGNLNSKLGDVGESTKAAGESSDALGKAFGSLGEDVTSVSEKLGEMIGGPMGSLVGAMSGAEAGAIAVGAAFAELTIHEAEWAEQLVNTSLILGTTTDELQTLQNAADLTGTNVDRLGRMVEMMTRTLETGSTRAKTMSDALNKMGISGADLGDVNTMLLKMSEYLEKTGGDTEQNRQLLVELGRGWLQVLPFVLQYGDASKQVADLALNLNQQQITDLHSAADAWNQLKAVVGVLAEELAATLAPAFVDIVQTITTVIEIFRTWGEEVADVLNGMQVLLGDAFATMLLAVQDFAVGAGTLLKDVFTLNWSAIRADFSAAWANLEGDFKGYTAKYQADWTATINKMEADTKAGAAAMNAAMATIKPPPVAVPGGGAGLGPSAADVKKAAEDRLKVREEEASEQAKIEDAQLAATQKHYETEYNLGNITLEQEYAGLTDVENKKYEAQLAAYQKDLAALQESGVAKQSQIVKIQGDEEVLTAKHNATLEDLRAKLSLAQDTADQQDADEALSTQQAEAAAEKTIQDSRLAVLQAWLNQRVTLNLENGRQEVADQTTIDNLKYNEDRKALTDRLAVLKQYYDDSSKEVVKANADIEALDNQHYAKQIADQTKADEQRMSLVKDSLAQVSTAFGNAWDTLFNDAVAGSTKQQSVWSKMFSDILKLAEGWAQQMAKTLLEALLFGSSGGPGAQASSTSTALTSLLGLPTGGLLGSLLGLGSKGGPSASADSAAFEAAIGHFQSASDNFNRILTGSTAASTGTTNSLGTVVNNLNTAATSTGTSSQELGTSAENVQAAADKGDTFADDLGNAAGATDDSAKTLGSSADALTTYSAKFNDNLSSFNTATTHFGASSDSLNTAATATGSSADILGNSSTQLGTSAGSFSDSIPPFNDASSKLSDSSTNLGDAATATNDSASMLGDSASSLGDRVNAFSDTLPPFSDASSKLGDSSDVLGTNANSFGDSINSFNGATSTFSGVTTNFNSVVISFGDATDTLQSVADILSSLPPGGPGGPGGTAPTTPGGSQAINPATITSLFQNGFSGSQGVVNNLFSGAMTSTLKPITDVLSQAFTDITAPITNVFATAIKGILSPVTELFGSAMKAILSPVTSLFSGAITGSQGATTSTFGNAISGIVDKVTSVFGTAFSGIGKFVTTVFGDAWTGIQKVVSNVFSGAWDGLTKVVGNVFSGAWDGLTKIVSNVFGGAFTDIKDVLSNLFSDIFGGIFSAIGSGLSSIIGSIGGLGSAGATAIGLPGLGLIGVALAAAGLGISELLGLFGGGRPKEEATKDIAQYASSNTPVLAELGKGAQALVSAGIPISSPQAGPIFGPYFDKARELEDVIRWGPSGLTDAHIQSLDATTLQVALTEMGNPGKAGTDTITGIIDAWNSYTAGGGTIDTAMKLAGIPALQSGGLIGSTGIALLHQGEIVLPESVSSLLQGLVPGAAPAAPTVVFHINALDSQDVAQFISDNRDMIADAVLNSSRGFRNLGRSF